MAKLTKSQIEKSRARAAASLVETPEPPSGVVGADPDLEYRILDLASTEGRLIAHRDRLEREGWIRLDDPPPVRGIARAEVWAMPLDVYRDTHWAAQVARDQANRLRTRGKPVKYL